MTDINAWPPPPDGVTGTEIRNRKIMRGGAGEAVRAGSLEPKVIVTETDEWVIYAVYSSRDGRLIAERAVRRRQFEEDFERRDDARELYQRLADTLNELELAGEDITIGTNIIHGKRSKSIRWNEDTNSWEVRA